MTPGEHCCSEGSHVHAAWSAHQLLATSHANGSRAAGTALQVSGSGKGMMPFCAEGSQLMENDPMMKLHADMMSLTHAMFRRMEKRQARGDRLGRRQTNPLCPRGVEM